VLPDTHIGLTRRRRASPQRERDHKLIAKCMPFDHDVIFLVKGSSGISKVTFEISIYLFPFGNSIYCVCLTCNTLRFRLIVTLYDTDGAAAETAPSVDVFQRPATGQGSDSGKMAQ
jgi:hypothetical protein